jgi:hypothetical protein
MHCDYRLDPLFTAGRQHSPIVIELRERKLALFRFNAGPFDGTSGFQCSVVSRCGLAPVGLV